MQSILTVKSYVEQILIYEIDNLPIIYNSSYWSESW